MKTLSPFSFYDIIGYLLTGFFLLLAISHFSTLTITEVITSFCGGYSELIYAAVIVMSYLSGHIVAFVSAFSIETLGKIVYGNPAKYLRAHKGYVGFQGYINYFKVGNNEGRLTKLLRRFFLLLSCFPIVIIDFVAGTALGLKYYYTLPFDTTINTLLRKKIKKVYESGMFDPNDHKGETHDISADENYFDPLYHYLIIKSEKHFQRIHNYVALYGFTRSITLIGVVVFWMYLMKDIGPCFNMEKTINLILIAAVSYIFYMAYLKFYKRYFEEVYLGILGIEMKGVKSGQINPLHSAANHHPCSVQTDPCIFSAN